MTFTVRRLGHEKPGCRQCGRPGGRGSPGRIHLPPGAARSASSSLSSPMARSCADSSSTSAPQPRAGAIGSRERLGGMLLASGRRSRPFPPCPAADGWSEQGSTGQMPRMMLRRKTRSSSSSRETLTADTCQAAEVGTFGCTPLRKVVAVTLRNVSIAVSPSEPPGLA